MSDEELGVEGDQGANGLPEPAPVDPGMESVATDVTPPSPQAPDFFASEGEPQAPKPPRKNTGLIVVVASIVLILLACVFIGPVLYRAVTKTGPASTTETATVAPTKAKITVTIGFVQALLNGDTMAIKAFLEDDVQSAITQAQWEELASLDASAVVTFDPAVWAGDSKATVTLSAEDATGTLVFTTDAANPLSINMQADIAGTVESDAIILAPAGSGWRVVSISNGTDSTVFDAALVKSMVATEATAP
jgi:hypothetical protein